MSTIWSYLCFASGFYSAVKKCGIYFLTICTTLTLNKSFNSYICYMKHFIDVFKYSKIKTFEYQTIPKKFKNIMAVIIYSSVSSRHYVYTFFFFLTCTVVS